VTQPHVAPHPSPFVISAEREELGPQGQENAAWIAAGIEKPPRLLILRKFARDIPAVIGLALVVFVIVIAIFGPWIAPHPGDVVAAHLLQRLKPPSVAFPFGTDNLGRDLFSRVILGTRGALEVALAVVALAAAIGVPLGLVAGYATGWLSEVIMRVTDVFLSLPQLILALALAQLLTPSLETAMLALALTYWPFFTRLVFAETRRLRASLFVDALQGIGASSARIVFAHILPNAISPVIVRATIGLGFTILVAAVLGFLGVGATPPQPDWGLTISESRNYLPDAWWYAAFPGLAILLAVLGFNLLGDGLRDLVDPRLRRSR
jgi:peptide/nickel transport system permease protein